MTRRGWERTAWLMAAAVATLLLPEPARSTESGNWEVRRVGTHRDGEQGVVLAGDAADLDEHSMRTVPVCGPPTGVRLAGAERRQRRRRVVGDDECLADEDGVESGVAQPFGF